MNLNFLIKCKTCNTNADIINVDFCLLQWDFWCETCRIYETIKKSDEEIFDKFYRIDIKDLYLVGVDSETQAPST